MTNTNLETLIPQMAKEFCDFKKKHTTDMENQEKTFSDTIASLHQKVDTIMKYNNRPNISAISGIQEDDGQSVQMYHHYRKDLAHYLSTGKRLEGGVFEKSLAEGKFDTSYFPSTILQSSFNAIFGKICPLMDLAQVRFTDSATSAGFIYEGEAKDLFSPEGGESKISTKALAIHPLSLSITLERGRDKDDEKFILDILDHNVFSIIYKSLNSSFLKGDGDNKPKGLLSCAERKVGCNLGIEDDVAFLKIIENGKSAIEERFHIFPSMRWIVGHAFASRLLAVSIGGRNAWSIDATGQSFFQGSPIYITSDLPADVGIYGNFYHGYTIALQNYFVCCTDDNAKKFNRVASFSMRVGGDITNPGAFTVFNNADE